MILVWQLSTEHNIDLQYKDTGSHIARKYNILHWLPCGMEGIAGKQASGRTVIWLPKFLWWTGNQIILAMGLRARSSTTNVPATFGLQINECESNSKLPQF